MNTAVRKLQLQDFTTIGGVTLDTIHLFYKVFGQPLHTAPIVLVNHALTGNSTVTGVEGWWSGIIGAGLCIDTDRYTVLSFNIPGNGYDGDETHLYSNYKLFTARDIASIFAKALTALSIANIYAVIGGSVGGGIAWELAVLQPNLIQHLIPVAADWRSSDWLRANCLVQEQILLNSNNPVHDARLHAMLMYRTPESFEQKFDHSFNEDQNMYNVESWLLHHGSKLNERFTLSAYKLVNHILSTIDITKGRGDFEAVAATITSDIHLISVDSDLFFTAAADKLTVKKLQKINHNVTHGIITSVHGHDAFLIEFQQLKTLLQHIF